MIPFGLAALLAAFSGVAGWRAPKAAAWMLCGAALAGLTASGLALWGGQGWSLDFPGSALGGLLRFDAVAAFFLVPVLVLSAAGSVYGLAYWGEEQAGAARLRLVYGLTTACLVLLVAAAHALTFLLAWEGMAITAFLLVITEDREPEARHAGWVYLMATHTGTLCLFGAFALMATATGGFAFAPWPAGFAASARGTVTFLLFLVGFGLKAGVLPLHIWLPLAHAAAPSHVSSFMSGVLIKMGILGLVRLLSWVPDPPLWWGETLVTLGALSGILGVALALGQHDLKRLLAYHSIENIGIILLGLGLGTLGKAIGSPSVAVLGYAGALFHVLNHGLFKGLLFLDAGSVVHATGTRDLEKMGGLSRAMPVTSGTFLAGAWAICGLPPFNGFASEWLIYLAAFQGLALSRLPWSVLALGALALIGALALACFAKAYGAIFLGAPRSPEAEGAHEAPRAMAGPLVALAAACLLLGLAPGLLGTPLDRLAAAVTGHQSLPPVSSLAWFPALSALAVLLALLAAAAAWWARPGKGARRDLPTWDCGYAGAAPRAQYTASSFADGLVSGLRFVLLPKVHWKAIVALFPSPRNYHGHVPDPVQDRALAPGLELSARGIGFLHFLQGGHLSLYLLYVLVTLLTLLIWMVV